MLNVHFKVRLFSSSLSSTSPFLFPKIHLNQYYAALLENPSGVCNLAELIAFDNDHSALEEPVGFQDQSMYAIIPSTSYPSLRSAFNLIASEATTGRSSN